jgi:hypothetical protein
MMTSWKLWSALHNPPALNPIFRRVVNVEYLFNFQLSRWRWLQPLALTVFSALTILALLEKPHLVLLAILIVPMSFLFIVLIVPILLVIGSNLLGAFWSSAVSTTIVRERERGRYDLLCLLPDGVLGVNWAIGSGCMHRGAFFDLLNIVVRTLLIFGLIILGIMVIITLGVAAEASLRKTNDDLWQAVRTVFDVLAVIIGYYAHYVQGIALSPLTGILTAMYVRNQLEARLFAPIIFLALQFGSYALTFLIAFNIIPSIYQYFFVTSWLVYVILPFVQLAVFCGIREGIFWGIWMLVKQELNVQQSEFNRLVSLS